MFGGSEDDFTQDEEGEGLTIDKLSAIKMAFAAVQEQTNGKAIKIEEVQKKAEESGVSAGDLNEFLKEFIGKGKSAITAEEFESHAGKVEQLLLEMCLGGKSNYAKDQSEYVPKNVMDDSEIIDALPKEGEKADNYGMSADDYSLEDYIGIMKEILTNALGNNKYQEMSQAELGKLVKDLNNYINIVKRKHDTMVEEFKDCRNKLENKEYQETFLQNKIQNYQETLDECQAAKEKLERELEKQFAMEGDFEKLKDRNAELDIEILNSTQEVQKLQTDNKRMERELRRVKRRTEELEREAMESRSDKAEIMVELERTQLELASAREELAKKSKEPAATIEDQEGVMVAGDGQEVQKEEEANSEAKEKADAREEAKAEVGIEKASGNEAELKRKLFEFKKKIDSLQAKVDVNLCLTA